MAVKPSAVIDLFTAKVMILGPRLMHDLGLLDFQSAGCWGNAGHESGGFRALQERRPVVRGSKGGWGFFQETGSRRKEMEAWCRKMKLNPASDEANYGYLLVELRGTEHAALEALKRTKTLEQATEVFCAKFERPGTIHLASRLVWARKALPAIKRGLTSHDAVVAQAAAKPASAPVPAKAASKPTPKPAPAKRAVAAKKPAAVRKHAAPVHHIVHQGKRR